MATMPATLWVPLRRSRSWPPPMMSGSSATPSRTASTPTPFGPPNLWALSDSRSTCGQTSRRSSQHAAWTASVCSSACGACRRTTAATGARSVIVPTSLLTAITLTTETSSSSGRGQRVEHDPTGGVDGHDGAAVTLDGVQHGVVLDGRAHGSAAPTGDRAGDRRVVGLGAAPGEHDLARTAPDHPGDDVAGLVDGAPGIAGEAVRTARVGEALGEERQHRLDRLGAHRRGGRVVEVDQAVHGRPR